jgi:MoaA/NifB/PqqE/SkfB family radical SAM enzyme
VNARKAFVNKFINKAEYFDAMECFSKPLLLWFFLTYRCNLTCIMCGRGRNESAILPFEVFEKLSDWIPYAQRIEWQGGEAFLAEYFRDLVIRVGETYPYIAQSITTNGLLITEEWTKILARLKVDMYFSIDAVVKDTYENIRKGGSFERLTRNLEAMNNEYSKLYDDSEYGFNANVIVMKSNAGQLGLIPEFCKKYGIRTIRFNYLDPVVSPEEDLFAERNNEAVERLRGSISEVKEKCRELGIQFKCFLPPLQRENEKREKLMPGDMTCRASGKEYLLPCRRPWTDLLFHPDGTVQPGCACYAPVGNILSDSVEYIWNGNMMKLYRKHVVEGTPYKICSKHCLKGLIP